MHSSVSEVTEVYDGMDVFAALNDEFAEMPLAVVANGDMVCVHGAIPRA
jgi:hypothetical protein